MHSKMEVIIVLGGWFVQEPDGNWRTTNFKEAGDNLGMTGDRVRVVAASFLGKKYPKLKIMVSGSSGRLSHIEDCPTLSAVLKKELIELGVNPENIIEEEKSTGTYQQLKNSFEIVRRLNLSKVGIISNEYHLPRIEAFLEHVPNLNCQTELISAEKVAIDNNPEYWKKEIEDAYASEDMKKRIALEQKGVQDLREGKYKLN